MELLSNKQFDINEFCGHIVLLYTPSTAHEADKIKSLLDDEGYAYIALSISEEESNKNAEDMNIFGNCSCLIALFDDDFFEKKNTFTMGQFWYYIGIMRSRIKDSIIPYCISSQSLQGTPLQALDIMNDVSQLKATLSSKFCTKVLKYNYYENRIVNRQAAKRIAHRSLHLKFHIYENAFENALDYYQSYYSRSLSPEEFDELLIEKLVSGCRVVSFGDEKFLPPQMSPYKGEIHSRVADYPNVISGKKSYVKYDDEMIEQTGIRAELTIEILMPVHKILGTYFKCFISTKNDECPVYMILALLEGDFITRNPEPLFDLPEDPSHWLEIYGKGVHIDKEERRLYFSSGLVANSVVIPDEALDVGNSLDYVFPL